MMATMHITAQDREAATRITRRIRTATDEVWELLLEAWSMKAWASLGYKNWTDYCRTEFDIQKSHAYQLVNQGTVVKQLREAFSATAENLTITEREARDLPEPLVGEVIDRAREQVAAGASPQDAVSRVIADVRAPIRHVAVEDSFDDELPARDVDEAAHVHQWVCLECGEIQD